ncbi:hypothetical protein HYS48_01055 [Candidatus Woesearchaeota archaeon]|nr:hypothetical protein [Candidatus Woesearchaeota archaeon]
MDSKNNIFIAVLVLAAVFVIVYFGNVQSADRQGSMQGMMQMPNMQHPASGGASEEILAVYNSLSPQAKSLYFQQSDQLTKPVDPRVVELDQLTIGCFGPAKIMQMDPASPNMGGQCCGALKSAESYRLQLEALDRFIRENGNLDIIPRDPYDVPVEQAQKLIALDNQIVLSPAQQQLYDAAIKMSHHGGPCCCKCWKWYVMSGLAKKLIVDYGWDEHKIAELWDTSSSCGHDEDTDMHQHYATQAKEHASHDTP